MARWFCFVVASSFHYISDCMSKRDAICDSALELFAEKGIEATSTREIAEQAGTAEGTLYRHFDGKADLAQSLYSRCANQLQERLAKADKALSTPLDRLEALVRGIFDFYATKPASCTYLLSTRRSRIVGEKSEMSSPPIRMISEILDDGMRQGVFRKASSPLVAGWILAMIQRTVLLLKADALPLDDQEVIDRTVVDGVRRLVRMDDD